MIFNIIQKNYSKAADEFKTPTFNKKRLDNLKNCCFYFQRN